MAEVEDFVELGRWAPVHLLVQDGSTPTTGWPAQAVGAALVVGAADRLSAGLGWAGGDCVTTLAQRSAIDGFTGPAHRPLLQGRRGALAPASHIH